MRKSYISRFIVILFCLSVCQQAFPGQQEWQVIPLPEKSMKVVNPVVSLNGTWKFNLTPPAKFWDVLVNDKDWPDILVPGEPAMQGFQVEHDKEIAYRREFTVPKKFSGQRIFLRFEGVYSYAKVWVKGNFIREHFGGFTSWDCEVTDYVKPGQKTLLAVGVVDNLDDISFASGYAKHPIGGILRDVYVYCLGENYIRSFDIETELDKNYENAVLKITSELASASSAVIKLSLSDPSGKKVKLIPDRIEFSDKQKHASVEIKINDPVKWDAEHPNLYKLTAILEEAGKKTQKILQRIGFRKVEVRGNKILVNGKQIHLRGACRHDIHPTLGRTSGREFDKQDVLMAKEANINFIRTSHYPPSKAFLQYCDQYGVYVEEETAVCFIGQGKEPYRSAIGGTQHKPEYTDRYLSRLAEMIDRDRNHPSVIIWSIGNENRYGMNFQKSYDLVKQTDPSRPVMFSYPKTAGDNICYEIESLHYPSWLGEGKYAVGKKQFSMKNFTRLERPVIADEWAHVACYCTDFIKRDPGIRNFWGESMKKMWENAFVSNGTAGGAIWGMIDETFQLPDKCVGYGEWGIYDTWRRRKPEFWMTKKAYSPIRIENKPLEFSSADLDLQIPVKNWFDHTDFNELLIKWQAAGKTGKIKMSLAPGKEGELVVPAKNLKNGDVVHLRFYDQFTKPPQLIDEFKLPVGERMNKPAKLQGPAPQLRQNKNEITVTGNDFHFTFDKQKGCIKEGVYKGQTLITGGPLLNLTPMPLGTFSLKEINAQSQDDCVNIYIAGDYGKIGITYDIRIDGHGLMETKYSIKNPPEKSNSYHEVGIAFDLVDDIDLLQWERNGLYSVYPDDHIGRNAGSAKRASKGQAAAYRKQPNWPWALDMYDYFYQGKDHAGYNMTHDFRSLKEYIYLAVVSNSKNGYGIQVESDGKSHGLRIGIAPAHTIKVACKGTKTDVVTDGFMHLDQQKLLRMYINRDWAYVLGWGNQNKDSHIGQDFCDIITMRFIEHKGSN